MDRRQFLVGAVLSGAASRAHSAERLMLLTDGEDRLLVHGSQTIFRYRTAPVAGPAGTPPLFTRSGYLHPLHSPNGAMVTDDFPADHPHQRGVFFAWTKTAIGGQEPDFWNLGAGKGRIRSTGVQAGKQAGSLVATHLWEMHSGEEWTPVLDETWEVSGHAPAFADAKAPGAAYVVDLVSRQKPRVEIRLPEYRYGGMAVRGARDWMTDRTRLKVVTSEGKDLAAADASRARWVDLSGRIGEQEAGVALLEHPSNLGAPNMLRVPPDHPYAVFSPPKAGPLVLEAGREYRFRYRLVVHNGPADAARLEREWKAFSGTA